MRAQSTSMASDLRIGGHVRTIAIAILPVVILILANFPVKARPALFFYPPPWTFPDGSVISSPLTVSEAQATTLFPAIREMSGVVVIVNWSAVCPLSAQCDFTMVDRIIDYWHSRGKQIVLCFATVGFPTRTWTAAGATYQSATPDWVLQNVDTYSAIVPRLGGGGTMAMKFPAYSDRRFISLVQTFVHQLKRFDGRPGLAELRMSLGLLGEDNPNPVGALRYQFPNFGHGDWLSYCRTIVAMFRREITHSKLEVDLGVIGWIAAIGSPTERVSASNLIQELVAARVFLAFDGLDDTSAQRLGHPPRDGIDVNLQALVDAHRSGGEIGLEAIGPITASAMQNPGQIIQAVSLAKPDRLVFFSILPAVINKQRDGASEANRTASDFLRVQPTADTSEQHAYQLMQWYDHLAESQDQNRDLRPGARKGGHPSDVDAIERNPKSINVRHRRRKPCKSYRVRRSRHLHGVTTIEITRAPETFSHSHSMERSRVTIIQMRRPGISSRAGYVSTTTKAAAPLHSRRSRKASVFNYQAVMTDTRS